VALGEDALVLRQQRRLALLHQLLLHLHLQPELCLHAEGADLRLRGRGAGSRHQRRQDPRT
jgi:hypothetical protein